jgi:hypothetical protein
LDPEQIQSTTVNSTDEALDCWAFVEIMGHSKIAGRLTTRKMGVSVMLQVDVLKPDGTGAAYSKLYSPAALFSITPVDRDYCLKWSQQALEYDFKPVPYIAEPARQLTAGEPDDFLEWCAARGFQDVADDTLPSAGRVMEALEVYKARHDRDKVYDPDLDNDND